MTKCISCGGIPAQYSFHVLEVQTLHVRDLNGAKRVQALGMFQDFAVCRVCTQSRLNEIFAPGRKLIRSSIPFGLIFLLGVVLTAFFVRVGGALRLMGFAALLCGVLGLVSTLQNGIRRKREFEALSREQALEQAAWECVEERAPKKDRDNDLTYIPITEKTLTMKNGDLMVLYKLLPQIADKAYQMIHETEE